MKMNNGDVIYAPIGEQPKKYAVGKELRNQLSEKRDTQFANTFMSDVMDKVAKDYAKSVDDEIYEALRPKIEFDVEESFNNIIINVIDYKEVSGEELSIFIQEMDLNIFEQFGGMRE